MKDKATHNIEKKVEFSYDDGILFDHNKETYEKIVNGLNDGNKVLFEQATGTGKSYLALKYLHDFGKGKKVLFVSPSDVIKNYFVDTYKEVLGKDFDCELKTCLYQGLNGIKDKKYDIIIFDEAHRMGAPVWGLNAKTLMSANPDAKVLGMTATLDRADGVDVKQYFDNKEPVSQVTLVDALQIGILPNPDYTIAKVDFEDDNKYIDQTEKDLSEELKTAKGEDKKKIAEFLQDLKKAKKKITEHKSIPEILSNEIATEKLKKGKFIVFCPLGESEEDSIESQNKMEEMIKKAPTWFSSILGGKTPNIYKMHSNFGAKHNDSQRKLFEADNSDNIKLLFAINMLNEGLHVGGIDGVLMFRSTSSKIIYLQQLGRAMSARKKGNQPKIFDFVANLTTAGIEDVKQIAKTANTGHGQGSVSPGGEFTGGEGKYYIYDFKLNVENLEALEFIDSLKKNIYNFEHRNDFTFDKFYNELLIYQKEYGDVMVSQDYINEDSGYKLGHKVSQIRSGKKGKKGKSGYLMGIKLSSEEYKQLEELGFVWDAREAKRKELMSRLTKYYQEHGDLRVPFNYVDPGDGCKLGYLVAGIRNGDTKLNGEEKVRLEKMGFVWNAVETNRQELMGHFTKYFQEYGHLRISKNYVDPDDGYKLGQKAASIRTGSVKLNDEEKQRLDEMGFIWNAKEAVRKEMINQLFDHLEKYYKEKGNLFVPQSYKDDEDGYKLGQKVDSIRRGDIKLDDEEKQQLEEMGFIWNTKEVARKELFDHLEKYYKENGHLMVSISYKDEKDGYKLGQKVGLIRTGNIRLNEEEKQRLDEMGFVWNARKKIVKNEDISQTHMQENLGEGLKNLDPKPTFEKQGKTKTESKTQDDRYEQMPEDNSSESSAKSDSFKKGE